MNYMRYAGVVIALTIGVPVVLGVLRQVTGINLSSSAAMIIPAICAAMIEGQKFASRFLRVPTRAETMSFVVVATLIAASFQALFTATVITNHPQYDRLLLTPPSMMLIIGTAVFVVIVIAICNLVFLRMSCKNQLKALNATDKTK
ncbi:hypothetical protein SAMN04488005_2959 [Yoonia tamlensis]|uniref:Uncharacterized protein n=1 Tax=Yoonia tamlensis TaxID=390270 RepID=A0A1I6HQW7_9RHOB|nr:ABZJ_00895 family protein [Yoonia tamlensis]SFR56788.1 hypothetical protein SAMN04488005_2959 [Yoonia tamlensis]